MACLVQSANLDVNSFTVVIIRLLTLHLNVIKNLAAQAYNVHLKCLRSTYG